MKIFNSKGHRMKKFFLTGLAILVLQFGFGQIPAGYYDAADGLSGEQLKTALHNIIKNHTVKTYADLWTILKETDEDPNNSSNFILIYTRRSIPKTAVYPDWNREHVWAKSHGFPDESDYGYTDAHHLRPSDVSVNEDRGDLDFDEGGTQHTEATGCYYDSDSWEPHDDIKGDIARMMFYMVVRYEGDGDANDNYDLELVDYVGTSGTNFGKLSTLLKWHNEDPVDDIDRHRNEIVYSYQENRNPFIDHPEYVAQIWGGSGNMLPSITNIVKTPSEPTSTDAVSISATITDSDGSISSAELHWGLTSGTLSNTITMSVSSGTTFITNTGIPAQANGTTIYFEIEATDNESGINTTSVQSYVVNDGGSSGVEILNEKFSVCPPSGWLTYSVTSNKNWTCGSGYESINAYGGDVASNDWLISPAINLDAYENERLTFSSWTRYADTFYPAVKLKYSTNYSGSGNPTSAIWTELSATWPAENSQVWGTSGNIDISTINGSVVYFAFHYTSSGTGAGTSSLWEIDSVLISGDETVTNSAPEISNISITPTNPDENQTVTVSADISDSDGTISSAKILWGTSSNNYLNEINMNENSGSYSGTIPGQTGGTVVYFKISATDNEAANTQTAEYSYSVSIPENENPVISGLEYNPLTPTSSENVNVSATITDSDGTVSSANIKWGTTSGIYGNTVSMSVSVNVYTGAIPAQADATHVYFVVEANDNSGGSATSSEQDYIVANPANEPPGISDVQYSPTSPTNLDSVLVSATVTDADGTIASVLLKWKRGSEVTIYEKSMLLSESLYKAYIPAQEAGKTIYFMITATDNDNAEDTYLDGTYIVSTSSSSNMNPDLNNLQVFPNPVKDKLTIKLPVNGPEITISLFNILGNEIVNETIRDYSEDYIVYFSDKPKGVYFLNISINGKKITKKIIVN